MPALISLRGPPQSMLSAQALFLGVIHCVEGIAQKLVRVRHSLLRLRQCQRRAPQLSNAVVPSVKRRIKLRLSLFQFGFCLFDERMRHLARHSRDWLSAL